MYKRIRRAIVIIGAGGQPAFFICRGHGSKENEKELQQFKDGLAKQF